MAYSRAKHTRKAITGYQMSEFIVNQRYPGWRPRLGSVRGGFSRAQLWGQGLRVYCQLKRALRAC